jgi:Cu+-exporting ATPase
MVNLATRRAQVQLDLPVEVGRLADAVEAPGYGASSAEPALSTGNDASARREGRRVELRRRAAVLGLGAVLVIAYAFDDRPWSSTVQLVLALPVYPVVGWVFHRGALLAARHGAANMDTLVSVGSSVAFWYSAILLVALPGETATSTSRRCWSR